MTLVRAIGFHWHAVQRDLLVLGFRAADMFTPKLTAGEVLSIVLVAPTGSAVRHSLDEGYSVTDHLLATLSEQQEGLIRLPGRHARPGVAAPVVQEPGSHIDGHPVDSLTIVDFEARRAQLKLKRKANG